MGSPLTIYLFGHFEVHLDGIPVSAFESDKARALLGYLCAEHTRPHAREKLADLLWPELPSRRARSNLSQALYNLRIALGGQELSHPFLLVTRETLQLHPQAPAWIDYMEFERLLASCDAHRHPEGDSCQLCTDWLQQAVTLYRGKLLEGYFFGGNSPFDEWLLVSRERCERRLVVAFQAQIERLEHSGELERAIQLSRVLLDVEPIREPVERHLIRLLAANGQDHQALAQYQSLRGYLKEALGVEPDPGITALVESLSSAAGRPGASQAKRYRLPEDLTPFIGRQENACRLAALLEDPGVRLVSLVGPGGSGKTRLAVHVARQLAGRFQHGACLVPLVALTSGEELLPALGDALGLTFQDGYDSQAQLLSFLADKHLLLLLDSFEHLLESVSLVERLLAGCPQVKILVTTRSHLKVRFEHLFELGGMPLPPTGLEQQAWQEYDALQLFVSGAVRVRSNFRLGAHNLQEVSAICRLVQGMPLGILLAAAWTEVLSCAEILANMASSFDLIDSDWSDLPPHQRGLRATFNYSWRLLNEPERRLLAGLSVFRGGFTRLAAEQVSGCSIRELLSLVDKSLVARSPEGRFEVHELVRQFAAEKLSADPLVEARIRAAHSRHYLKSLERWGYDLKGPRQGKILSVMEAESENLQAAWRQAVAARQVDLLGRGLDGLALYASLRSHFQLGELLCRLAVEMLGKHLTPGDDPTLYTRLQTWQAHFQRRLGKNDLAAKLLESCRTRLERRSRWDTRPALAFLYLESGAAVSLSDARAAIDFGTLSLELYSQLGDLSGKAAALKTIGRAMIHLGNFQRASEISAESLEIFEGLGDLRSAAECLASLGFVAMRIGDQQGFERFMGKTIQAYEQLGDRAGIARSTDMLGRVHFMRGDFDVGIGLIERSVALYQELGFLHDKAFAALVLANALLHNGEYDRLQAWASQAQQFVQRSGHVRTSAGLMLTLGALSLLRGESQQALDFLGQSIARYQQVGHRDELATALAWLATAHLYGGEMQPAHAALLQALQIAGEDRSMWAACFSLPVAAFYLARSGQPERALELQHAAGRYPVVSKSRWYADVIWSQVDSLASGLPPGLAEAARQRRQGQSHLALVDELVDRFSGVAPAGA